MKNMESKENYLETILRLKEGNGYVRSVDIANELGFSKPSISIAMKKLKESDYVTVGGGGQIELTASGRKIAESIYERHLLLTSLFMSIGISEKTAMEDACRVEHYISEETFEKIKEHFNK